MMAISQASAFLMMQKFGNYFRFGVALLALIGLMGASATATSSSTTISPLTTNIVTPICSIYHAVHTAVFILGLALLILGATLYAGGNIAPGNLKGQIQGYGLGMITGGIVGVVIAIIAPWLLGVISGNNSIAATCP